MHPATFVAIGAIVLNILVDKGLVVRKVKVCKHYRMGYAEAEAIQAEHPWNAYVEFYDSMGNLVRTAFYSGFLMRYLYHLAKSPECIAEVKITCEELFKRIKEMEEEWRYYFPK